MNFIDSICYFLITLAGSRPASKSFYFLAKPQSVNLKWGKSVILEAFADSASPVSYKWFLNGKPVQIGGTKSIVGMGNLKILYAKEADAGSYRVVAESAGKTLEATAVVNIMSTLHSLGFVLKKFDFI